MNILLCIPFPLDDPRGNSVAARRLAAGFNARGARVGILDAPRVNDARISADLARSFRPDVVLVLHAWRCAVAFRAISDEGPFPMVVSMRGTDLNEMLDDPAIREGIGSILGACSGIVVFHQDAVERLGSKNPSWSAKAHVIPNGAFLPSSNVDYRARLGISAKAFVFGAVAGLRKVKRPLLVLPWLARLRQEFPLVVWLHAGQPLEPGLARELQEFARRQLETLPRGCPWVCHVDQVPHQEIDSFLRAADVFVAASRSEGMPHAVREAMLAGRPSLLSDIPGHRNMASPEQEALFFTDETDFLRQARQLVQEAGLRARLGEQARLRVEDELRRRDEIGAYLAMFAAVRQKGFHHG